MSKKPDFIAQFKAARRSAVPLIAVRTYDATAATRRLITTFKPETQEQLPIFTWNCCEGVQGMNKVSKNLAKGLSMPDELSGMADPLTSPMSMLLAIRKMPEDSLVFMHNLNRFWNDSQTKQAIWNLRDLLKALGSTLVMLIGPSATLPEGLGDDVLVIDEALPTEAELGAVVDARAKANDLKLKPEIREKAIDALIGLAMFPAEQALEMCFTDDSIDVESLWERKRQLIEQTKGLAVWRGGERFADIGGYDNAKNYLARYVAQVRPRAILLMDEVQRAFAGHGTENTGIKSGFVKKFLTWMQDNEIDGVLLIGPAGSGKSNIAKALGNEANCPTIALDLQNMQQKEVGASEENLERGLGVADAIARGRILVVGTTNNLTDLPVELRRRFQEGTFFCDLPSKAAQEKIWAIYEAKYKVSGPRPEHTGWTGAEIKTCCRKASKQGYTLIEAGEYIVPVCRAGAATLRELRLEANGKYIDAEGSGIYEYDQQEGPQERKVRKIDADVMAARGRA